ncbi:MAG: NAD-dependent epimerase [Crocinitomicaceae bacterium]|nr:NAD-dependent epimerase [Crocinitomicaceae bacterium]
MGKKLVIGSSGQIGTELIHTLTKIYGENQVVATDIYPKQEGKHDGVLFLKMDVLDSIHLASVVKEYEISEVYLLAALLSAVSESKIKSAWDLNMNGLFNVLELARQGQIKKVFWPSSIAVFGPTSPKENSPQQSILEPNTVYGISKSAGERWCDYYHQKFNVDVRSIRYPGIISYKSLPGGGTTDYAVDIFHEAIKHQRYSCFIEKDVYLPMMYMDDAIRATIELMQVEKSTLSTFKSYNIAALSFSPDDIAKEISTYIPDFKINYSPDFRNKIAKSWPSSINDQDARKDWGWKQEFDLKKMTLKMIEGIKSNNSLVSSSI